MKLSSMRLAIAGSGSMRLVTLASVLNRKCGSICACSARRLARVASRSMRWVRSRSRASAAAATASRSRQKKMTLMIAEIRRLVSVSDTMAAGSVSQLRKPTSTMKELTPKPRSTPPRGTRLKYTTLAAKPPRRAAASSPMVDPAWNSKWIE